MLFLREDIFNFQQNRIKTSAENQQRVYIIENIFEVFEKKIEKLSRTLTKKIQTLSE